MADTLRAGVTPRKPGLPAPDFDLESHTGERVRVSDYRGEKSVVLFFMRAYTCLTCIVHAIQLGLVSPRLAALDTALLIIVPGPPQQVRRIGKLIRASYPVLADPDRAAFRGYGLGRKLVVWQQSGSALVSRDGTLAYVRRSTSPHRALDLDALMKAVEAASGA